MAILLTVIILLESSCANEAEEPDQTDLLKSILTAVDAKERPDPAHQKSLFSKILSLEPTHPNWPTLMYLLGETYLSNNNNEDARSIFQKIANWAVNKSSNTYGNKWGGSGVATIALWRWLKLLEQNNSLDKVEIAEAIQVVAKIQGTRFFSGMVRPSGLFIALPKMEEDIARLIAQLALRIESDESRSLFSRYLALSYQPSEVFEADPFSQFQSEIDTDRLKWMSARRVLGMTTVAPTARSRSFNELDRIWNDTNISRHLRSQAAFDWAYFQRYSNKHKAKALRALKYVISESEDPTFLEEALYWRGEIRDRSLDMEDLTTRFPKGRRVDDAHKWLANAHFKAGRFKQAVQKFQELRELGISWNAFIDSAYLAPAIAYFWKGTDESISQADQILEQYLTKHRNGVYRVRSKFWRARIAETQQRLQESRDLFEQVIKESPYSFYAIRSQMHLDSGPDAARSVLPDPASKTQNHLQKSFRESRISFDKDNEIADLIGSRMDQRSDPYWNRLRLALASGLYKDLVDDWRHFKGRLDQITPTELEERNLVWKASLFLATRQDALAARDWSNNADDRIRLALAIGHYAQDWSVAIELVTLRARDPLAIRHDLENSDRYLVAAFPDISSLQGIKMRELLSENSWPVGGSEDLSKMIMYSVVRSESHFEPKAISHQGAIGLFQFIPSTFRALREEYKGFPNREASDNMAQYLFDPAKSFRLWKWQVTEAETHFNIAEKDQLVMALMKHHAGAGNVMKAIHMWHNGRTPRCSNVKCLEDAVRDLDDPNDVELWIDWISIFHPASSVFVRQCLASISLTDAMMNTNGGLGVRIDSEE